MNKNHLTFVAIGILALVVSLISTQKIVSEHKIKAERSALSIRANGTKGLQKNKNKEKSKKVDLWQINDAKAQN
ncbi:MAG: hypothetical protein KC646_17665 [Candidatus Cloacimonetes bacterium]|nr:hypothetical protein [Candidatus Cloacimonadota bacterium]